MWLYLVLLLSADLTQILKSFDDPASRPEASRQLISLAQSGNQQARAKAALLSRKGQLPSLNPKTADTWYRLALKAANPEICLAEALSKIDRNQPADSELRCAALNGLPEAQYLLGRSILNHIAAEDEPHRFEGLAWIALSAKSGFAPAERRWHLLASELALEDLERVEQKTKTLLPAA